MKIKRKNSAHFSVTFASKGEKNKRDKKKINKKIAFHKTMISSIWLKKIIIP